MGEQATAERRGSAAPSPRAFVFRAEREGFAHVFSVRAPTARLASEIALCAAVETWGAGTSVRLLDGDPSSDGVSDLGHG